MARLLMFVAIVTILYGQTMGGGTPAITSADSATVPENSPMNTTVLNITTEFPANMNLMIVSQMPTSDPMKFMIMDSNKLVVYSMLDYEMQNSYVVLIMATDPNDNTTMVYQNITVMVTDVNEAPMFSQMMYSADLADGLTSAAGALDISIEVTDPENGTVTLSITDASNTNMDFTIVNNNFQIAENKTLDRSTTPTYALVILAVDDATPPLTGTATLSIDVVEGNSGVKATASLVSVLMLLIYFTLY